MKLPSPAIWPVLLIGLLAASLVGVAQAQAPDPPEAAGPGLPYDEAEAQGIDRSLMCPVCPAETIDQAQVAIALQMRQIVRQKLAQGAGRQEILDFFVERYGPSVLAFPPRSGFNLVAWVLPAVLVVAGLGAGFLVLRSMARHRRAPPAPEAPWEEELAPYLAMVDRELGLSEEAPGPPAQPSAGAAAGASNSPSADVEPRREGGRNQNG